ncbi:MAG: hypothetical protein IKD61_01095, partial [Oscillospiraceae bacterium]|nr:hypothetical protein [Oscillospiraceae bacterium]
SAHTSQKNPEIRQVFPDFSILSGRKISRSKLLCTQKVRFSCRARRKAQEYWTCIPSIFNEARRENILFALPYPYSACPKARRFFVCPACVVSIFSLLMHGGNDPLSLACPRESEQPSFLYVFSLQTQDMVL